MSTTPPPTTGPILNVTTPSGELVDRIDLADYDLDKSLACEFLLLKLRTLKNVFKVRQ